MSIRGISKFGGKRRNLILNTCEESQKKKMTKWNEAEELLLVQAMEKHNLGKNNKRIDGKGYKKLKDALDGDFEQRQLQSKVYFLRKDGYKEYDRLKAIIKGKGGLSSEKEKKAWSDEDELLLIKTIKDNEYLKPMNKKAYYVLESELGHKYSIDEIQNKIYSLRKGKGKHAKLLKAMENGWKKEEKVDEGGEEHEEIQPMPQSKTITFNNFRIQIGLDGIRLDGEVNVN